MASYTSFLHGNLPTLIDIASELIASNEAMAEKLSNPMKHSCMWLRQLCAATATTTMNAIDKLSPIVVSGQLLEIDRLCSVLEYPVNINYAECGPNQEIEARNTLARVATDMENVALWDEKTGKFKAPAAEQAAS